MLMEVKMDRERKRNELLELMNIPEIEKAVFLYISRIKKECAEQIEVYRNLKRGFRSTAYGDLQLYINDGKKKIKTYHFELHREENNKWALTGLEPQPPDGVGIDEIIPPDMINRVGYANTEFDQMNNFKGFFKTPSGLKYFRVQFVKHSVEHALGNIRIGKAPRQPIEPKKEEHQFPGSEENFKVIGCDWNYEEHTDEENLKQLFYTVQSRPEIKKVLLEEFFNRIKPWMDHLDRRKATSS